MVPVHVNIASQVLASLRPREVPGCNTEFVLIGAFRKFEKMRTSANDSDATVSTERHLGNSQYSAMMMFVIILAGQGNRQTPDSGGCV